MRVAQGLSSALLLVLSLGAEAMAQESPCYEPDWTQVDPEWRGEDAVQDPNQPWPALPPGTDIAWLSAYQYGPCMTWFLAFHESEGATGHYYDQVFWSEDGEGFATAADVLWVDGQVVRVDPAPRGGGRVGTPYWNETLGALAFVIDYSELGLSPPGGGRVMDDVAARWRACDG